MKTVTTHSCSSCGGPARTWLTSNYQETFCGYECRKAWLSRRTGKKKKRKQLLASLRGKPRKKEANKKKPKWTTYEKVAKAPSQVIVRKAEEKKPPKEIVPRDFYLTAEWRALRYKVLKKSNRSCLVCGRGPKNHGITLHVDHIKPVSKYPELRLMAENLQVLCEDCNLGKSNRDEIDWR